MLISNCLLHRNYYDLRGGSTVGWKGTMRSVNSSFRAMERDAQRRQRERERRAKELAKMAELEQAAASVQQFDEYIGWLKGVHISGTPVAVDWDSMITSQAPTEPVKTTANEDNAKTILSSYRPGFIDRTFKREEKKRQRMEQAITEGANSDDAEYRVRLSEYKDAYKNWQDTVAIAKRIKAGDLDAYVEALKELDPFSDITEVGSSFNFGSYDSNTTWASFRINTDQVVPSESMGLLKSGKLSVKQMPKGKYYELCQDYVCSCALRISRDVFGILPVNWVIATGYENLLDSSTGHMKDQAVLSVAIPRKTFQAINLQSIDPSDAMKNFIHRMSFKKTQGFSPVEPLSLSDIGDK